MYLETDHLRLLCKPLEEEFNLDKSLEHLLLIHDPFCHRNLGRKPGLRILEHYIVTSDLVVCDELLDNHLVSNE